jgi:hypothetical protein
MHTLFLLLFSTGKKKHLVPVLPDSPLTWLAHHGGPFRNKETFQNTHADGDLALCRARFPQGRGGRLHIHLCYGGTALMGAAEAICAEVGGGLSPLLPSIYQSTPSTWKLFRPPGLFTASKHTFD